MLGENGACKRLRAINNVSAISIFSILALIVEQINFAYANNIPIHIQPAYFYSASTPQLMQAKTPDEILTMFLEDRLQRYEECMAQPVINTPISCSYSTLSHAQELETRAPADLIDTVTWFLFAHQTLRLPNGDQQGPVINPHLNHLTANLGKRCPEGWQLQPGTSFISPYCTNSLALPAKCATTGNPINFISAKKTEVDIDYAGRAELNLIRRYVDQFTGWQLVSPARLYDLSKDGHSSDAMPLTCRGVPHIIDMPQVNVTTSDPSDILEVQNFYCLNYLPTTNSNQVLIKDSSGALRIFNLTGQQYVSAIPNEKLTRLAPNVDDKAWALSTAEGRVDYFDNNGYMIERRKANGMHVYKYTYENGRLKTQSNHLGDTLVYNYDTYEADGKVVVTVPNNRNITYYFEQVQAQSKLRRLKSVTHLDTPASLMTYLYENANYPLAITGVIDGKGVRYATWGYDDQGRAVSSEHAGNKEKAKIDYTHLDESRVRVTNSLGKINEYHFSVINSQQKITHVVGEASENCAAANQYKSYYPNGTVQTQTDWKGNVTLFERDTQGRTTKKTQALKWPGQRQYGVNVDASVLQITSNTKITQTCWHPIHNKPERVIEPGRVTIYDYFESGQLKDKSIERRTADNEHCP